jgi:hypothetical protein
LLNVIGDNAVWEVDACQVIEITALPEKKFLIGVLIGLVE